MPINPNAQLPEDVPEAPAPKDPDKYRFEGFDLHGGNQGVMARDIQNDTLIWRPRQISQPAIWSRRSFSTFKIDMRR